MPQILVDARVKQISGTKPNGATAYDISTAAVTGFIKFESAQNPVTRAAIATGDLVPYTAFVTADGTFEEGWGTVSTSAHTLARTFITRTNAGVIALDWSAGSANPTIIVNWGAALGQGNLYAQQSLGGARLTLVQGNPIPTTDQANKTTLYAEPWMGGALSFFLDAAGKVPIVGLLPASTVSLAIGTVTAAIPKDVFLDIAATAPGTISMTALAWTSATARATAVDLVNGRLYKAGDYRFLLLGTFYPNTTTQTQDTEAQRFVWNALEREEKALTRKETAGNWTYASTTVHQANGNTANQVEIFNGYLGMCPISMQYSVAVSTSTASSAMMGIGEDSTTAYAAECIMGFIANSGGTFVNTCGTPTFLRKQVPLGYHRYTCLESNQAGAGTTTFYQSVSGFNGGLSGTARM